MKGNPISVAPSAKRLVTSLRDIGYSFESAVADIVDNSIAAGARQVDIQIVFSGRDSSILIKDDGQGMTAEEVDEAMRFGSRRRYASGELGRYGLGLKTASLSQCKRFEVTTKTSLGRVSSRVLDLDLITATDDWTILESSDDLEPSDLDSAFESDSGTIVRWTKLDRILSVKAPEGGWARRRVESLGPKLERYLAMVFHRFLSGEVGFKLKIRVNGKEVEPWDPFARAEPRSRLISTDQFEVEHDLGVGIAELNCHLLPTRQAFSSDNSYEASAGLEKWNKQQGIYIYRANRLVQWGAWAGIRTIDEHTKFARASLDFDTDLDAAFNINVAKMRVTLPSELRKMISRPINELCIAADAEYRRNQHKPDPFESPIDDSAASQFSGIEESGATIGLALRAAAARTGRMEELNQIMDLIRKEVPELAKQLGFV